MELFSGILAFFAFFIVCITGLIQGVMFNDVLMRGILALLAFTFVGKAFGYVGRRIVLENLPKMEDLGHHEAGSEGMAPEEGDEGDEEI